MEYMYIIQFDGRKSFKVGTVTELKGLKKYEKHTLCMFVAVSNPRDAENELLQLLNERYERVFEHFPIGYKSSTGMHYLCFNGEYDSILDTFLSVTVKYPQTFPEREYSEHENDINNHEIYHREMMVYYSELKNIFDNVKEHSKEDIDRLLSKLLSSYMKRREEL